MLGKPFFGNSQSSSRGVEEPGFEPTRPPDQGLEDEYRNHDSRGIPQDTLLGQDDKSNIGLQAVQHVKNTASLEQRPKKPLRRALWEIRKFLLSKSKIETRIEADKEASRKMFALEEENRKLREEVGYLRIRNRNQAEEIVLLTEDTIPGTFDTIPSGRYFEKPLTRDSSPMITDFNTSPPVVESENAIEDKNTKRETIMHRFGKSVKGMVEAYDTLPTSGKVAISAGLIGVGMFGVATGSGAVVAASWAGKVAVRGMGSYLAGRTAEKLLRARKMRKVLPGSQLSKQDEKNLKRAKYGVVVAAFLAGSVGDIKEYIPDSVAEHFTNMFSGNSPVNTVSHSGLPATNIDTSAYDFLPAADNVPSSYQVDLTPQSGPPEIVSFQTDTVAKHISVVTPTNSTLTNILLNEGLPEMLSSDELAKLTAQGKQNLIGNITKYLTQEQLRAIGVTSMNADILKEGEIIDIKKLAEIAKGMTVNFNGEKVSLFERALKIS